MAVYASPAARAGPASRSKYGSPHPAGASFRSKCGTPVGSATRTDFSISGGDLPLTIAASGSATLTLNITTPGSSYGGVLDLVAS